MLGKEIEIEEILRNNTLLRHSKEDPGDLLMLEKEPSWQRLQFRNGISNQELRVQVDCSFVSWVIFSTSLRLVAGSGVSWMKLKYLFPPKICGLDLMIAHTSRSECSHGRRYFIVIC